MRRTRIWLRYLLVLIGLGPAAGSAGAVTYQYNLAGNFSSALRSAAGGPDFNVTTTGSGSLRYSTDLRTLDLSLRFEPGNLHRPGSQTDLGGLGGTMRLHWNEVIARNIGGDIYVMVPTETGSGGGRASMTLEFGNQEQNFNLVESVKAYTPDPTQRSYATYSPFSGWLYSHHLGTYAVLGMINGENSFHAWLMSSLVNLNLGRGLSGAYTVFSDIHMDVLPRTPPAPTDVPEPASLILLISGLLGIARVKNRKWSCAVS